jgi:hypothetical protein
MRLAVPPSIGRNVDVGVVRGQIDQAALGVKDVVVVDRRQVIDWNRLQLGLGPRLSRQSRPSPLSRSPRPSGAQWVPPGVGWRTPVRPIPHRHRRSRPPQSGRVEPSRHNFQVFGGYWVMAPQGCSNASLPRVRRSAPGLTGGGHRGIGVGRLLDGSASWSRLGRPRAQERARGVRPPLRSGSCPAHVPTSRRRAPPTRGHAVRRRGTLIPMMNWPPSSAAWLLLMFIGRTSKPTNVSDASR